eukprot:scaffold81220_cov76-Phaeocystis_antarctica.AAC.1
MSISCSRLGRSCPQFVNLRPIVEGGDKGYGLKCPGWSGCSLAAISQTTTHMHGHHEATMGLAGVSLGRELRALALSHTASVRRGTA